MYSDWMYLFTVPAYSIYIKILLVVFIVLPIILIILKSSDSPYYDRPRWQIICAMFFGYLPLIKTGYRSLSYHDAFKS